MSEEQNKRTPVQARVLRKVRVLKAEKPQLAVLRLEADNQKVNFIVTKESMQDIAQLLLKNAEGVEPSKPTSKG